MKQINRLLSLMMAVIVVIGAVGVQRVEAAPTFQIIGANVSKSKLEKGDSFGIYLEISKSGDEELDFEYANVTGSVDTGTGTSRASVSQMGESGNDLYVGGLTYLGGSPDISVSVTAKVRSTGEKALGAETSVKLDVVQVSDGRGELKLKDTSQIAMVAGETKKVDVLIENTGTATVRNPSMSVSIEGDKVEGISIKEASKFKIFSISPKSSSRASFEIETSKAVKAGNYKLQFNLAGTVETVSLRVTSDFMPPRLEFSIEGLTDVKPGEAQPIKIKVKNIGDSEAKQVKVELENKEEMAIVGGSNVKYISKIPANQSAYANFTVKVITNPKQNMLPIKINYSYQDEIGGIVEDKQQYIYIPLKGGTITNGEVLVDNIIGPSATMGVGQTFNVKFTLSVPKGTAKNIKVSVAAEDPESIVPNSQNLFMIQEMTKGTKRQYGVTMSATPNAGSQSHPIKIEVSYDSPTEGEQITFKQYTSVSISNPKKDEKDKDEEDEEESKKGQPKVIVGEYKVTPTIVKAGEEFQLEIGFLNTNKIKSVHNLKANLTVKEQGENDAGNVFTPVNASNTFYIADLSPEEMVTKNITMYTIPNALPKTYQVELELEYEDANGNQITATENIGIPVEQTTKIDIAEIEMDMFTLGMPMPLNINLYNTGKTNISNLMIYTEGEGFTVQENKMFVGNLEKGASEYYSPTIIPEVAGMLNGTIVVEYEETTGEIVQIRKDFEFEVMEMMEEFPDDMEEMPMPEEKNKKLPIIIGGIAILAAALITTIIIRKKRKEEKEIEFDLE